MRYCFNLNTIRIDQVTQFGGKNASLGEMTVQVEKEGIHVPEGFAVSTDAFERTLLHNDIKYRLDELLKRINPLTLDGLAEASNACRNLIDHCELPLDLKDEIIAAYKQMGAPSVAVRSSATAEDLPTASFAGQHESFLNVEGEQALLKAVLHCYRSLYSERAIKYRLDNGFEHMKVALSVGIQKMVRSDLGSAGVIFTLDPESGFRNVIYITGAWGLGEAVVQGAVNPDEFLVFKPTLKSEYNPLLRKVLGTKKNKLVYDTTGENTTKLIETTTEEQKQFVLQQEEIIQLAQWSAAIEKHYHQPMDIEWAKDGITNELYFVQARPETVHAHHGHLTLKEYKLKGMHDAILEGTAIGHAVVSGPVKIIHSLADAAKVKDGDILVAEITHPDWNTLLRKAICIVTDKGGRTSHASIVARELGIPAIVGTETATKLLQDGQIITVTTAFGETGKIYNGKLDWSVSEIRHEHLPETKTTPLLILADPARAFHYSFYPAKGVGLLRMEFIIANSIMVHPMALIHPEKVTAAKDKELIESITKNHADPKSFFVDQLASSIAIMAAAFYPQQVIVRMSDFKTNEYRELAGGHYFEPKEENPMLGLRGASRYYRDEYKDGFGLECAAIKKVREQMGLTNLKVMIPFCRTVEEGLLVLKTMEEFGLKRGVNGLEVYVMAEIPSNVLLAEAFAEIFDGFSIGSNDLTQLTLGIDRDATSISDIFDENNPAVKQLLQRVIKAAKLSGRKIGLCGQAPSDNPAFAGFLVDCGIDSISFNPDGLIRGIEHIAKAEKSEKHQYETTAK